MTERANGAAPARPMTERMRDVPGLPPAGQVAPHGGVARTEFFGRLKAPAQNGTGKVGSGGR